MAPLALALAACGGDGGSGPRATQLRVDPGAFTLDIGSTVQLVATPVDKDGNVVVSAQADVSWLSVTPAVATVSNNGLVTAVSTGTATVEARAGSLRGTAIITVNRPPVGQVVINPGSLSLTRGASDELAATIYTNAGGVVTDRAVAWTSLDEAVASVAGGTGGRATVTARGLGTTTIRATSEGISSTATVVVAPDPVIALTDSVVTFVAARLATDTAERTVQVSNAGGGQLSGLTATAQYEAGQPTGWLQAALSSASDPSTLTLRSHAPALAEGVYRATVTVASSLPIVAPRLVRVQLTVTPGPAIALSADTVHLTTFAGGPPPAAQTVSVTNGGGAVLSGLALGAIAWRGPSGWATVALAATTGPTALTVTPSAAASALPPGTYTASVPITSTLAGVAARSLAVSLVVLPPPVITLSPPAVAFTAALGGAPPAPQTVGIGNAGGGTLSGLSLGSTTYGAGASGWLAATLQGGATSGTFELRLAVATAAIGTGSYVATVPVQSSNPFVAAVSLTVTLNVGAAQVIALSTQAFTRTTTEGAASPAPVPVTVTNGGTGTLSGLFLDAVAFQGGSGGWLSATLSSSTAPSTIQFSFSTSALPVGTFTAALTVRSSLPGVLPATVTITLQVQSGAVIALGAPSVTFQALTGANPPPAQGVSVTNGGVGALTGLSLGATSYGASQPTGWLSASLSGTSAPATLALGVASAGLAAGTYTATVPLQSSLSGVATVSLAVTLVVNPATTMSLSASNVTLNAPNGGGNPAAVNVTVSNTGANPLIGLTRTVSYITPAPTAWLTATLFSTTGPTTLSLTAFVASLASGTYVAVVSVESPTATNSPQQVQVTLVVPSPTIALSVTTVNVVATQSIGTPSAAIPSVGITNSGGGILSNISRSVTYASGSNWLTTALSSTTAPATLTLSLNTAVTSTMARGKYQATVQVSAPGATNTPRFVTVNLDLIYTYNTHVASLWSSAPTVTRQCTFGGCHDANAVANGARFDLLTGDVYTRLLTLTGAGGLRLVQPNAPGSSLMYTRTASTTSPMPPASFGGPNANIYTRILYWITDGALRQ